MNSYTASEAYLNEFILSVKIEKLSNNVRLPARMTKGSVGWDIFSLADYIIPGDGGNWVIPLGFKLEIPRNYYITFVARSSMAKNGIIIPNAPATIDSDFREQCHLLLWNIGKVDFRIKEGDRIAQMILRKYENFSLDEVNKVSPAITRYGGFGSTGR